MASLKVVYRYLRSRQFLVLLSAIAALAVILISTKLVHEQQDLRQEAVWVPPQSEVSSLTLINSFNCQVNLFSSVSFTCKDGFRSSLGNNPCDPVGELIDYAQNACASRVSKPPQAYPTPTPSLKPPQVYYTPTPSSQGCPNVNPDGTTNACRAGGCQSGEKIKYDGNSSCTQFLNTNAYCCTKYLAPTPTPSNQGCPNVNPDGTVNRCRLYTCYAGEFVKYDGNKACSDYLKQPAYCCTIK